jgi:hypothetical protein
MAYRSKRERKRAQGGKVAPEDCPEPDEKARGGAAKKRKAGGRVEGEAARKHLGKRARGGTTKKRADGGDVGDLGDSAKSPPASYKMSMYSIARPKEGGGPGGTAGLYREQDSLGDRSHPPQSDDKAPVRARGGRTKNAREAANHPDGPDKVPEGRGTDEWEVLMDDPRKRGGRLTAHERQKMPAGEFALPGKGEGPGGKGAGAYPIEDRRHAIAALSRMHNASPAEQATIKRKVHSRYPDIGEG